MPDTARSDAAEAFAAKIRSFIALSDALCLSHAEERALLDVSATELFRLRAAPANGLKIGGAKLERRVDYAISILTRMLNATRS